jgi:cytochrome c551/c552
MRAFRVPRPFVSTLLLSVLVAAAAGATPPLEKSAKKAGFPADSCQYCHTFDTTHMEAKARQMGISPMNCGACHGSQLPKTGPSFFNERGKWLVGEKVRRKVKDIDVKWLKDYRTDASAPPGNRRP